MQRHSGREEEEHMLCGPKGNAGPSARPDTSDTHSFLFIRW